MVLGLITPAILTDIADAIHSKTGDSGTIKQINMAEVIRALSSASTLVDDQAYFAAEVGATYGMSQVAYIRVVCNLIDSNSSIYIE